MAKPKAKQSAPVKNGGKRVSKTAFTAPFRRELAGLVSFFLGLFALFGYFETEALFVQGFTLFLKGMIGVSFWTYAPAFFTASYILMCHRGKPVLQRVVCALLLPLFFSCLCYGFIRPDNRPSLTDFMGLWDMGQNLEGSGVVGSLIGGVCTIAFTGVGTILLFLILSAFLFLGVIDRTLMDFIDWVAARPSYDPMPKRESPEEKLILAKKAKEEALLSQKPKAKSRKKKKHDPDEWLEAEDMPEPTSPPPPRDIPQMEEIPQDEPLEITPEEAFPPPAPGKKKRIHFDLPLPFDMSKKNKSTALPEFSFPERVGGAPEEVSLPDPASVFPTEGDNIRVSSQVFSAWDPVKVPPSQVKVPDPLAPKKPSVQQGKHSVLELDTQENSFFQKQTSVPYPDEIMSKPSKPMQESKAPPVPEIPQDWFTQPPENVSMEQAVFDETLPLPVVTLPVAELLQQASPVSAPLPVVPFDPALIQIADDPSMRTFSPVPSHSPGQIDPPPSPDLGQPEQGAQPSPMARDLQFEQPIQSQAPISQAPIQSPPPVEKIPTEDPPVYASEEAPEIFTPNVPAVPSFGGQPYVPNMDGPPVNSGFVMPVYQENQSETTPVSTQLDQRPTGLVYQAPPISLLKPGTVCDTSAQQSELEANRQRLEDTLNSFSINASIQEVSQGPSVTMYKVMLEQGVKLSKLVNLSDDIALALGASGVRIAPVPDQISLMGIEVPNKAVTPVEISTVIGSANFLNSDSKVSFAVGKDINGSAIVGNIAKFPHLLVAGTTGSGKSVCTNSLIISLLYKASPEEVRLIMVDPKMVELQIYNGIPHLLIPVVTDPKKAAGALQWAVHEMLKRYRLFSDVGTRDLASYNAMADQREDMERMPQIVVVIDELADLMLVAAKEVEDSICRVAQMGRASGMHLIVATQRPSADVITGLMKANIPSRISFAVSSGMESRIILDTQGAEKLVGRGDMLYAPLGEGKPTRVQGCLISDSEVAAVVDYVKQHNTTATYSNEIMDEIEQNVASKEKNNKNSNAQASIDDSDQDEMLDAAIEVVVEMKQASTSMIQRRCKLGYARAARIVDQMEDLGIVGPSEGSKPRQLLITKEQWQEMKYRRGGNSSGDNSPVDRDPPPWTSNHSDDF